MRAFATRTILAVWYAHLNIEDTVAEFKSTLPARKLQRAKADLKATQALLAKPHTRTSLQAKQAKASALADYAGKSEYDNQRERARRSHYRRQQRQLRLG